MELGCECTRPEAANMRASSAAPCVEIHVREASNDM